MRKILTYYNFIIVTTITLVGFVNANNIQQLIIAMMFFPVMTYFAMIVAPRRNKALKIPENAVKPASKLRKKANSEKEPDEEKPMELKKLSEQESLDMDRRAFVKLIGSAGLSVFFLSLFTKKAQAAFFGSAPGPGIVSLKDSTGTVIDPAVKHPTDGYRVYKIDDSAAIVYYGFKDKDGNWFILEDDSGTYMYAVGTYNDSFDDAWATKNTTLSYSLYEDVF
jgi:hypothetical protein